MEEKKKWICEICESLEKKCIFKSSVTLQKHIKKYHSEDNKVIWICKICEDINKKIKMNELLTYEPKPLKTEFCTKD